MQNRYKPSKQLSSRQFSQFDLGANNSFQPKDDDSFSSFQSDHEAAIVLKKQKHKPVYKQNRQSMISRHQYTRMINTNFHEQQQAKILEKKEYLKLKQQLEIKNTIIFEKNNQMRNQLNKYQQLNRINQTIRLENKGLKEEISLLKQKINSSQSLKSAKKAASLAKQNNCLKIQIERLKSDQQFNKLNEEVQHKNHLMKEVQNLHEKHKRFQEQLAEQMKRRQNQLKVTFQKQMNKFHKENQWMNKFFEVFIDMVLKIPVEIQDDWSLKKKVRIGWKAIKLMIKRSLHLGIQPPQILIED